MTSYAGRVAVDQMSEEFVFTAVVGRIQNNVKFGCISYAGVRRFV